MTTQDLFVGFQDIRWGDSKNSDISCLAFDSRLVQDNGVFVAIKGHKADGHSFVEKLCSQKKVLALVVENRQCVPSAFKGAVAVVSNTRAALDLLASRFYSDPAQELMCIGVTGTNGKTTICAMIECILSQSGWPTAVMGTIDHHFRKDVWKTAQTTADPITLYARLREFIELGAKAVVMEVSSHALKQNRVDHVSFDRVVFSNLSRDHLDYHESMENYFQSKQKLFLEHLAQSSKPDKSAIINVDDPYGKILRIAEGAKLITYGHQGTDLDFKSIQMNYCFSKFKIIGGGQKFVVRLPVLGIHNIYNSLGAISVAHTMGISLKNCVAALEKFSGVTGRLQRVPNKRSFHIFVDYAHTDQALASVLLCLCKIREKAKACNRIITIFGCGGGRDRGKRPLMGKVAKRYSDVVILTSDNPRFEDPMTIIDNILSGTLQGPDLLIEADRCRAIRLALDIAKPHDVILIAGKGHEDYQEINGEKIQFNDFDVTMALLRE